MPTRFLRILTAFFAVVLFGIGEATAQSAAQSAEWRLSDVSGVVRVLQPGAALAPGTKGQVLAVGSTITTGANGSATVDNGAQRIVIAGNSRTTIAPDTGGVSRILQDVGSALFQVDRREAPHFRVETPLLAAVVKGTTFTVTAGAQEDVVHVTRGLVAVSANGNGRDSTRDVAPGETVRVLRDFPGQLALAMRGTPTLAGVTLPSIDYAKASGDVIDGKASFGASQTRAPNGQTNKDNSPGRDDNGLPGAISLVVLDAPTAAAGAANFDNGNGNGSGGNGNGGGSGSGSDNSGGNGNGGGGGGSGSDDGGGNGGGGGNGNSGSGGGGNGNGGSGGGGNSGPGGGGKGGGKDSD